MSPLSRVLFLAVVGSSLALLPGAKSQDLPPPVPDQPGVEVQPRGPVHEGFAQPFNLQPEPNPVVPRQPPAPIPEMPPDMKPEGKDSQWIPGYWAWDSEQKDFLWISGTYRNAPPGRQYVPGYWARSNDGWRWVQGYWAPATGPQAPLADASQYQPQFTPQPPAPLENGPNFPGPQDSIYTPGYWAYQNPNFVWRPGFYSQGYPNRMWIPPNYNWTPGGYVFNPGYWDYPFADRGLLFAPVAFAGQPWLTPGWNYQPSYAINGGLLLNNLFSLGSSFYFGNYFGPTYAGLGYRPWYGASYSPYLGYYRWQNRGNPGWYTGLNNGYVARGAGSAAPFGRSQVVAPLNQVQHVQVARLNQAQLAAQRAALARSQQLAQQRQRVEAARVNQSIARSQTISPAAHGTTLANPYRTNVIQGNAATTYRPASPANHAAPAYRSAPVHHQAPAYHHAANYHASAASHGRAGAPAHHGASAGHGHGGHRR